LFQDFEDLLVQEIFTRQILEFIEAVEPGRPTHAIEKNQFSYTGLNLRFDLEKIPTDG